MAYPKEVWEKAKVLFEHGKTLAEIAKEVGVKDKSQIGQKAKKEGWVKGKNLTLVEKEVKAKQTLIEVDEEKSHLSRQELTLHEQAVSERMADIKFFSNAHRMAASMAVKKMKQTGTAISMLELNQASTVIARSQDGVLGKEPTTVINNSNTVQNANAVVIDRSPEKVKAIRDMLDEAIGI